MKDKLHTKRLILNREWAFVWPRCCAGVLRQPSVRIKTCTEKVLSLWYVNFSLKAFVECILHFPLLSFQPPGEEDPEEFRVQTRLWASLYSLYTKTCYLCGEVMYGSAHFMCVWFFEGLVKCYLIKLCFSCSININFRKIYSKCSPAWHLCTNTCLITPCSHYLWLCNAFRFELDNLFKIVPQGQLWL